MGLVVPSETATNDGVSKREKVLEDVEVNGVARREGSGDVGAGTLVSEEP